MQWPLRVQELGGKQCQGTGAKTGRAIPTSMAKASRFLSRPVMVAEWFPIMLLLLDGPLDRLIQEHSFAISLLALLKYGKGMGKKKLRFEVKEYR